MVADDSERLWEDLCECEDQLGLIQEEVEDLKAHIKWLEGWIAFLFDFLARAVGKEAQERLRTIYEDGKDPESLEGNLEKAAKGSLP